MAIIYQVGIYTTFILVFALIVLVGYLTISLYNKLIDNLSVIKSKIISGFAAVAFTVVIIFSFYSTNLYLFNSFAKLQIIDITSKISVGDEAHLVIKGKPYEEYYINVIGYFYNYPEKVKTNSSGLATVTWLITYSAEPRTYDIDVYDYNNKEINELVSTKITIQN